MDCVARDGAKRERQFCSAVRLGGEDEEKEARAGRAARAVGA